MASIVRALDIAYDDMKRKEWDRIYFFVDVHSTILMPSYSHGDTTLNFYPRAEECLKLLSERKDVVLTMYTCQDNKTSEELVEKFKALGIVFDYINENPEVKTGDSPYGNYDGKPYFNVLLDDKAGFEPSVDWRIIQLYYQKRNK